MLSDTVSLGSAAAVLALAIAPSPAQAALTISPEPGTPDASPTTQISILGAAPRQINSIRVSGSSTGLHRGAFRAYSGRRGASFVLRRPLAQGERVRVSLRIGARAPLAWTFTVARLAPEPPVLNLPVQQPSKLQRFVSRPDLLPPQIAVHADHPGSSAGDIFLTPLPSPVVHPESNNAITIHPVGPGGPMIIDRHGRVVWFDQLPPPVYAINFRAQQFNHRQVLTWWQGKVTVAAFGEGEGVIADSSYRTLRTVHSGNGYPMDLHEFSLTPDGDALMTIYSPILVHLRGTPAGTLSPLLDTIVQEVDIRSGLVVWEWHAYGHIPLGDSYATPANSADFDAYHFNSVEPEAGDRVLISARDTSALYLVQRSGGRIVWTLGGKASSFHLGPGARFYFQHDAHMISPTAISVFDDEAGPPKYASSSRALILKLDLRARSGRVLRQYHRPGTTSAQSEGSVQELSGGNVFAGFGSEPFFSEFAAGGRLLFDGSLPTDDGSYRAYTFPWHAAPDSRPALVVKRSGASVSAYVSWNGATEVLRWQLLAGLGGSATKPVATVSAQGFETRIALRTRADSFRLRALGSRGRVLATTPEVHAS